MADFADCLHAEVEEHFDQKIVHQALLANYQRLLQEQPVLT
jgi:hypothetical protein